MKEIAKDQGKKLKYDPSYANTYMKLLNLPV